MTLQPLAAALVHAPVVDRRGDLVTTAVTNLDLHDIARSARTFDRSAITSSVSPSLKYA